MQFTDKILDQESTFYSSCGVPHKMGISTLKACNFTVTLVRGSFLLFSQGNEAGCSSAFDFCAVCRWVMGGFGGSGWATGCKPAVWSMHARLSRTTVPAPPLGRSAWGSRKVRNNDTHAICQFLYFLAIPVTSHVVERTNCGWQVRSALSRPPSW